jgi:hypothetical protein
MSTPLSAYLQDVLQASICTRVVFVQDNCAGPSENRSNFLDDSRSAHSWPTTARELSRWDSNATSVRNAACVPSPETKQRGKNLRPRPPRRQVSLDEFEPDSAGNVTPAKQEDLNITFPTISNAFKSSGLQSDTTNTAPRKPPRRTSSRLTQMLLRTLETHLDSFPEDVDQPSLCVADGWDDQEMILPKPIMEMPWDQAPGSEPSYTVKTMDEANSQKQEEPTKLSVGANTSQQGDSLHRIFRCSNRTPTK